MAAPVSDGLRVRVAAVLLLDGNVVLVRHRKEERAYHLLPGGGVESGETLEQALLREVREETGLEIEIVRPLYISDTVDPRAHRHIINVTFLACVIGGSVTRRPDDPRVEAVDLISPGSLEDIDLRPPITRVLADDIAEGFREDTRYLGSLWVDDPAARPTSSSTTAPGAAASD